MSNTELDSISPSLAPAPVTDVSGMNETLLFHSLLSHLSEGVIITDRLGTIVFINPPAQRMIDYRAPGSAADWCKAWAPLHAAEASPLPLDQFPVLRALRGETPEDAELLLARPNPDENICVHMRVKPLKDPNALVVGCLVIVRDITEHKQLEKDLIDISGEEKRRIGRDLHDGVCQTLTGLKFICNALFGKLSEQNSPQAADISEIQQLVSQALLEADTVSKGLFPIQLETEGLVSALEELANKTSKLYHISCRFLCDKLVFISNPEVAVHVYRIVQESLTNAFKHGRARNIVVWLAPLGRRYVLIVKDDGPGREEVSRRRGMGMRIMSYRAELIGASLQFEPSHGEGATLTCEFADDPPAPANHRRHGDKKTV